MFGGILNGGILNGGIIDKVANTPGNVINSVNGVISGGINAGQDVLKQGISVGQDVIQQGIDVGQGVVQGGVAVGQSATGSYPVRNLLDGMVMGQKSTFKKLAGSSYIPNNSTAALAMHPEARLLTIRGILGDILVKKFQIEADLVQLCLLPIMAVLQLAPFVGVLDADSMANLRYRRQMDTFLSMSDSEVDSVYGVMGTVRNSIPGGDKRLFDINLGFRNDNWVDMRNQLRASLFGHLDSAFDFVGNLVPDAFTSVFELGDMYSDIHTSSTDVLGNPIGRRGVFSLMSIFSDDYTYHASKQHGNVPVLPLTPGPFVPRPDCGVCVRPLVDVTRTIIELIVAQEVLILEFLAVIPRLGVECCLLLLHIGLEAVSDIVAIKIGVIELFRTISIDVIEAFLSFEPFHPLFDCDPNDPDILFGMPVEVAKYPGGLPIFQQLLQQTRTFYTYYFNLLNGFDLMPDKFSSSEYSDLMDYLTRKSDGSMCEEGLCYDELVGFSE